MTCAKITTPWHAVALFGLLLTVPSIALAEHDGAPPERPLYGLAMAGAYVATPLLTGLATVTAGPKLGVAVFMITPAAVHLAYGDVGWAIASLFGPAVLTAGGALLFLNLSDCDLIGRGDCIAIAAGAIAGYLAWSILDVTVSSLRSTGLHEKAKTSPRDAHPVATRAATAQHSFGPWLDRVQVSPRS